MGTDEREIRGIPLWLLREYLEEIGGKADGEHKVIGKGWVAHLSKMAPFAIGSLRVGQVRLRIEGDDETLAQLRPALDKKTMRAGA